MKLSALLLSAALATAALAQRGQPAEFRGGRPITVAMTDHGYVPANITMVAGRPYALRFVNRSGRGHDFTANSFLGHARVSPADQYALRNNKVDLDPGQSVTLHLIAPTTPGARYEFHSQHLTDAASGLSGNIYIR